MNSFNTVALETLESRTLYSTTPSPTILADMAAVQSDKDQINVDNSLGDQTARADDLQLAQDQLTRIKQVSTLVVKQLTDSENDKIALLTDRITGLSNRLAEGTDITHDLIQIKADRGNAPAEANDATQLATAQGTLASDIAKAAANYSSDQATFKALELQDRLNILDARLADDPAVDGDKEQILKDTLGAQLTLLAAKKQLLIDEAKLASDEKAGL